MFDKYAVEGQLSFEDVFDKCGNVKAKNKPKKVTPKKQEKKKSETPLNSVIPEFAPDYTVKKIKMKEDWVRPRRKRFREGDRVKLKHSGREFIVISEDDGEVRAVVPGTKDTRLLASADLEKTKEK